MWVYYLFAALLILQAVVSLRGGVRYLSYFRRELALSPPDFTPFASVIVPCRGLDGGLHENLHALCEQHYPNFEIVFVIDSNDDPALNVIEQVRLSWAGKLSPRMHVVVAGNATESGQKVHNLSAAVQRADEHSEVFVFIDTDARPRRDWLRSLIAPLGDERIGATTGYRWFVPAGGGLASHLRAVWNASIASALGDNARRNFCWGGSTAIRRATFERLDMLQHWRGTLSDDFALTLALQRARLPIHFAPRCLTASYENCSWPELLEFTTRQLKITRVYAPHLWRIVLASNFLFVTIFYGGLALALLRIGRGWFETLSLIGAIFILGSLKALLRLRAVSLVFEAQQQEIWRAQIICAHLCLWPFASALFLANALAAAYSRRITWRGITYELKSPTETVIINACLSEEAATDKTNKTKPARRA